MIAACLRISIVGLRGRYNERGDFLITTTQPNNESTAASTTELFFPHLADGGGYTTQFILKMLLLFTGVACHSVIVRKAIRWDAALPVGASLLGGISLVLWLGVLASSRWIAYEY